MPSRKVLITGAARGLGAAFAARFERDGFTVLRPTRDELDLAEPGKVEQWLAKNPLEIDALVNNAGENLPAPIESLALDHFEHTLTVNLTSAFLLVKAAAPRMAARGGGRIVNVSSVYSALARAGRAPYSASKAGLDALTRAAAVEFGGRNVLVNSVRPGFVDTELTRRNNKPEDLARLAAQTALGRLAQPAEIAEVVFWLGSAANTYLTGQTITVDGGFSIQ